MRVRGNRNAWLSALSVMKPSTLFAVRTFAAAIFLALATLVGPSALALPLAGTETEESGTEEAAPGIEASPEAGADAAIRERMGAIFAEISSLENVTYEVRSGVVTLSGEAPDTDAIDRAADIAGRIDGVVTVQNDIERSANVDDGIGVLDEIAQKAKRWSGMLPLIALAVFVALVIGVVGYIIAGFSALWNRVAPNGFLAELIASAIRFVFVILGIVVALDIIGAGALLGAVLGGAGVVGIALGFAMRDTIENYVASLMLSLRQPFRANDHVVIGEHEGRVIRLTSRATVLMTLDGNHLRIPNGEVFRAVILNYTRNPQRRFEFALGVDADDDARAARRLGRETLQALPFILDEPPAEARIVEVGDSNVVIRFMGWIDQREADWNKAQSRAIPAVKEALEDAGFGLPEPIYRLRFDPRTTALPFENIGQPTESAAATGDPAPAPAETPKPRTTRLSDADHEDVRPRDEIASMVEAERATGGEEKDLLDNSRPVE